MSVYEPNRELTDSERLLLIEKTLFDMNNKLFGNGQPGELANLRTDVDELKKWKYKAVGAISLLILIFEVARDYVLAAVKR